MKQHAQKIHGGLRKGIRIVSHYRWHIAAAAIVLVLLTTIAPIYAAVNARGKIYSVSTVPQSEVAIIFGAGLERPGKPSAFLESRLLKGIELYQSGRVRALLVSGDNRTSHYNEPIAMRDYIVAHGVPTKAVVVDYAGYNTYDTCYRAHAIFGLNKAVLVTHGYHLPRAMLTCARLGVQNVGVKSDRQQSFSRNYKIREYFSMNKAALQLLYMPEPTVLGPKERGMVEALH